MAPYEVPNPADRLKERGTWDKPHLYRITAGQNNGNSLIFHLQVGLQFYQCGVNQVGKTFVYFDCKTVGCKFRFKMKLNSKFVTMIPRAIFPGKHFT